MEEIYKEAFLNLCNESYGAGCAIELHSVQQVARLRFFIMEYKQPQDDGFLCVKQKYTRTVQSVENKTEYAEMYEHVYKVLCYYPQNEQKTLGSIESYVNAMYMFNRPSLEPLIIQQLFITLQKKHPWQSDLEKRFEIYSIPAVLVNEIIGYCGHREAIEYEFKQTARLIIAFNLLKSPSLNKNSEQTLEDYIQSETEFFSLGGKWRQNILQSLTIPNDPIYHMSLSTLSYQQICHKCLEFCHISDAEKLSKVICSTKVGL